MISSALLINQKLALLKELNIRSTSQASKGRIMQTPLPHIHTHAHTHISINSRAVVRGFVRVTVTPTLMCLEDDDCTFNYYLFYAIVV